MPNVIRMVGLSVLALFGPVLVQAATVHVAKSGSNSNSCTSTAGKPTIAAGIACLKGGDTLVLHAGTYTNESLINLPGGSASARTTVRTAGDGAVVLRSNTRSIDCLFCVGANYLTVDGGGHLTLDGGAQSVFVVGTGQPRTGITVKNTRITNARAQGFFVDQGEQWLVDNNEIDHNGPPGSNFQHGMYFSPNNSTISNNCLHDNGCYNLQNYSSSGHPPRNNTIRGNLFTRSGCGVTSQGSGHTFTGNMFYGAPTRDEVASGACVILNGPNQTVTQNTFYCCTIVAGQGGDSGGVVRDNTFSCPDRDIKLHTKNASLSNNHINRNSLAAPACHAGPVAQPPSESSPEPPLPAAALPPPRNLRLLPAP